MKLSIAQLITSNICNYEPSAITVDVTILRALHHLPLVVIPEFHDDSAVIPIPSIFKVSYFEHFAEISDLWSCTEIGGICNVHTQNIPISSSTTITATSSSIY